jgi:transposase-like protein
MSQRMGRKPLSTEHLRRVQGSPHAKQRMRVFLETLGGKITVEEACRQIGIGDSQFHQVRHRWLQEAVELLEPRRSGRPPHEFDEAYAKAELRRLEAEVANLRQQLLATETRAEVARILEDEPPKKRGNAPAQPC